VYTGRQAHEHGLVDELGDLDDAINWVKNEIDVDTKAYMKVISFPRKPTLFEKLEAQLENTDKIPVGAVISVEEAFTKFGEMVRGGGGGAQF